MEGEGKKVGDRFLYLHVVLLMVGIFCISLTRVIGLDIWWHLGVGRYLLQEGPFTHQDVFSFTGPYWDNKEWLFGIFVYLVERVGGLGALSFAKAILFTATFFTLFILSLRRSRNSYVTIGVIVLAALVCRFRLAFRPELFSYLFIAILLLILDEFLCGRRKALCFFPLLMLLWVNLHPLAFIGLIIFAIYIVGDLITRILKGPARENGWRRLSGKGFLLLVIIFAASCIAFTCNPISQHRFLSPIELMTTHSEYLASLTEIKPLPFFENPYFEIFRLLALFTLVMFIAMMEPADTIIIIVFGLISSFTMARNVPLLPVCATAIVACQFARFFSYMSAQAASFFRNNKKVFDVVLSVLLVCLIVWAFFLPSFGVGFSEVLFPERAIEYVKASAPAGEMFNIYDWGGFLIWNLYPRYKVFIDGRGPDAYPPDIWAEYQVVQSGADGWDDILDKYGVNFVLIATGNKLHDLIGKLNAADGWRLAYWDYVQDREGRPFHPLATIFVRDIAENRPMINAYNYRLLNPDGWALSEWSPMFELQAMGELQNYIKENPDSLDARNLMAMTYMRKCDDAQARGMIPQAEAMRDKAIEEHEKLAAANPRLGSIHYRLGFLYSQKGDEDRALAEYEEEIKVNKRFPPAYNNLGRIFYTRGELARAEKCFRKALKYEPRYVHAMNNLGIIYMEEGKHKRAIIEFKRALEIEPNYEGAIRNLSFARGMLDNPAETSNEAGQNLYHQGNYEEAEEQFRIALKHNPNYAVAINNLGAVCLKKRQLEEARRLFRRALEIDPAYEGALQNLKMVEAMLRGAGAPPGTY